MGTVRRATVDDAEAIADVAEAKRALYASYSPLFWRPHPEGRASHLRYVRRKLANQVVFVHEDDGIVDAYGGGELFPVPAVFGAAGPVCVVDGFATRPELWPTAGAALLDAIVAAAADAGASLVAVVSGRDDAPKCAMLERAGLTADSGWHIRERDRAPAASLSAGVRPAEPGDTPALLDLALSRLAPYQRYQPTFLKQADATIGAVRDANGRIDGFAIGTLETAPPVYDPGGPVLLVGDFLAEQTDGAALLEGISQLGEAQGAVLTAVVAGEADATRRQLLAARGFRQASRWYVRPLQTA